MGISDVLSNAASSITGSVAKAKIKIMDKREQRASSLTESDMPRVSGGNGLSSLPGINVAASLGGSALTSAAGSVLNKAGLSGLLNLDGYNREMEVQFNPASLSITTVGGDDDVQLTNYTKNDNGVDRGSVALYATLSFKLIFDQVSNTGAFVQDMLTISSSRAISAAAGAIGDALFGESQQSVQMIVEAFIATLRNPNTRMICFEWGEFKYEGMLSRINSSYTMFDINGNPIRAEVDITMYLLEQSVLGNKGYDYWEDAYYDAFIDGNPTAMSMMALAETGIL